MTIYLASIRAGITAARADRTTLYGFYTGEHSMDLFDDFLRVLPCLMFCGDDLAIYAYKRTIMRTVERLEGILAEPAASGQ